MKNTFGNALGLTIFGESHGAAVGAVLDGLAAGLPVDEAYIAERMDRRRARGDGLSTARTEPDVVEFLSGVVNGHTTGTPITMMIRNTNTRSGDYAKRRICCAPATRITRHMPNMKAGRMPAAAATFPAASPQPAWLRVRSVSIFWHSAVLRCIPTLPAVPGWRMLRFPALPV